MWLKYNKSQDFKRNVRHDDAEMSYCLDMKLPGKSNWISISYQRAYADGKASLTKDLEQMDGELSTDGLVIVEEEESNIQTLQGAPGSLAAGGSITTTSWRDPRDNRK